jgi:hypothetical protein
MQVNAFCLSLYHIRDSEYNIFSSGVFLKINRSDIMVAGRTGNHGLVSWQREVRETLTLYGAYPASCLVDIESTFPQTEQPERVADTHLHLLHRLRIQVAVSPQSHIPSCDGTYIRSGTSLPLTFWHRRFTFNF